MASTSFAYVCMEKVLAGRMKRLFWGFPAFFFFLTLNCFCRQLPANTGDQPTKCQTAWRQMKWRPCRCPMIQYGACHTRLCFFATTIFVPTFPSSHFLSWSVHCNQIIAFYISNDCPTVAGCLLLVEQSSVRGAFLQVKDILVGICKIRNQSVVTGPIENCIQANPRPEKSQVGSLL